MREVFSIQVDITDSHEVSGAGGCFRQILFGGRCDCAFFRGTILPGGVDTQKSPAEGPATLSARYILAGEDGEGRPARLFIENNGTFGADGECVTRPMIRTDQPSLAWLERAALTGRITGRPGGVTIHFFAEEDAE